MLPERRSVRRVGSDVHQAKQLHRTSERAVAVRRRPRPGPALCSALALALLNLGHGLGIALGGGEFGGGERIVNGGEVWH